MKETIWESGEKMGQFVDKIIRSHFWDNGERAIQGFDDLTENEVEHIINMGITLLLARDGIYMHPGHFLEAILNNKLDETFARADEINVKAIHWYILINHNIAKLK